jgi:hypothetical protein
VCAGNGDFPPNLRRFWGLDARLATKGRKSSSISTELRLLFWEDALPSLLAGLPAMALFPFHDRIKMFICYIDFKILTGT